MELLGGALHAQPDRRNTYHGTCRLHENAVIKMVNSDLTTLCTLTLTLSSLILIPQLILLQVKWRENSYHFYLWFSYWQKVQQVCIHWVLLCMYGIVEGLRLMFMFGKICLNLEPKGITWVQSWHKPECWSCWAKRGYESSCVKYRSV